VRPTAPALENIPKIRYVFIDNRINDMKKITISPMPTIDFLYIFFAGLLGAISFGIVFGLIGLLFADYLGFPLTLGAEEFMMGASMIFYSTLAIPVGAYIGCLKTAKYLSYTTKDLYSYFTGFVLIAIGLFLKDYVSVYSLLAFGAVSALVFAMVMGVSARKSQKSDMTK